MWLLLRKLEELTPESLLKHWQLDLRELALSEANRFWLYELLLSFRSKDLTFWDSLRQPERWRQAEKRWPALTAGEREKLKGPSLTVLSFLDEYMGEDDWEKAILRKISLSLAPISAEVAPAEPLPAPAAVAFLVKRLAIGAGHQRQTLSRWIRNFWEQRDVSALVAIVNGDGAREPWVQEAIFELQRSQVEGTAAGRSEATKTLQKLGEALWKLGKGRTKMWTQDERRALKRKAEGKSKASRRTRQRVQRLLRHHQQLIEKGETPESARKIVLMSLNDDSRIRPKGRDEIVKEFLASLPL
jgi:hypothetical protein